MATSKRVGNYATSANAVIRNSDAIFDAAMSGKPDFTKISKEAIKGRSLERRAVTKAEAEVASAGLKAFTDTNLTRMREDTKKEIADIKRPAKRMAGAVAGLGAIAGGYVMMEGNKKDKADRDELRSMRDAMSTKADLYDQQRDQRDADRIARYRNEIKGTGSSDSSVLNTGTVKSVASADIKPDSSSSSQNSSSSSGMYRSNGGGSTGMQYMNNLVSNGMSSTQAAALVGHLEVESANFKAFEEYAPNAYGTKGAGVLQWTNIPGGSQRRTEFINWSKNQGLNPKSFEANSGYLLHEMQHGNHWTGGGNLQGFKGISNLKDASSYLESNYIRPSAGSSDRRLQAGQKYLDQWNAR